DYTVDLLHADNALTENELVALWENITETIKYHPPGGNDNNMLSKRMFFGKLKYISAILQYCLPQ
ncbi:hypothetical protein CKJ90_21965, partial [Klebsiella pneumoniae]